MYAVIYKTQQEVYVTVQLHRKKCFRCVHAYADCTFSQQIMLKVNTNCFPTEYPKFFEMRQISQYVNLLRNQCTTIGCRSCVNNDYTYSFVTCLWKSL